MYAICRFVTVRVRCCCVDCICAFAPPMATLQLLNLGRDGFGSGLRDEGKSKCGERGNLLSQGAGLFFLSGCTRHSRAATVSDDI
jgi:hypothetical protein